jgi:hypothetical protein
MKKDNILSTLVANKRMLKITVMRYVIILFEMLGEISKINIEG